MCSFIYLLQLKYLQRAQWIFYRKTILSGKKSSRTSLKILILLPFIWRLNTCWRNSQKYYLLKQITLWDWRRKWRFLSNSYLSLVGLVFSQKKAFFLFLFFFSGECSKKNHLSYKATHEWKCFLSSHKRYVMEEDKNGWKSVADIYLWIEYVEKRSLWILLCFVFLKK